MSEKDYIVSSADPVPELDNEDIGVLLDALKAWESKDTAGEMLGDMVGAMLARNDPAERARFERKREEEKAKRQEDKRLREETSTLLRAKLITIRNRRRVDTCIERGLGHA